MEFVYPDFYPKFSCIASRCRHSCCRGWEIDIDPDTYSHYAKLRGQWGKRLRQNISADPTPHFILTADESCPFLRKDCLCELILGLGEDILCDICREHPRFYNGYPGREECGLGLCCEEAVRLLLEGTTPLTLLIESEEDGGAGPLPESLHLRDRLFALLRGEKPLAERFADVRALLGLPETPLDVRTFASFCRTLEQMDCAWSPLLRALCDSHHPLSPPDGIAYERLTEYFLYRHFAAGDGSDLAARTDFALLSVSLLSALEQTSSLPLAELVRLYSSEIEYSDENVASILRYIAF